MSQRAGVLVRTQLPTVLPVHEIHPRAPKTLGRLLPLVLPLHVRRLRHGQLPPRARRPQHARRVLVLLHPPRVRRLRLDRLRLARLRRVR